MKNLVQKAAEEWLMEKDKELGTNIIAQGRRHARGDRHLNEDLFQEGVVVALEAGVLERDMKGAQLKDKA